MSSVCKYFQEQETQWNHIGCDANKGNKGFKDWALRNPNI